MSTDDTDRVGMAPPSDNPGQTHGYVTPSNGGNNNYIHASRDCRNLTISHAREPTEKPFTVYPEGYINRCPECWPEGDL